MENKSLNQLKFIASIFVVLIHASAFRYMGISGYIFDFLLDSLSRFSVPVFFSISGYFLYFKFKKNNSRYLISYSKKILWLHLWVGLIYLLITKIFLNPSANYFGIKSLIVNYFYGGLYFHLWYLPALLFGSIIMFFISKSRLDTFFLYSTIPLYILGTFGKGEVYEPLSIKFQHLIFNLFRFNHMPPILLPSRNGLFFALPFIAMGYFFAKENLAKKITFDKKKLCLIILFLGIFQIFERSLAVIFLESSQGSNFFLSTYPLVFFILVLFLKEENLFPKLNKISHSSLDLYLWHPFFMIIWDKFLLNFSSHKSIIYNFLFTPLIILSPIILWHIKKRLSSD